MKQSRLANRYAKALFQLALEQKNLDEVSQDMLLISQTITENNELAQMLKSPIIKLETKVKVMQGLFSKHTNPLSLRFMILVAKKSREEYLAYFAEEFTAIYKEYSGLVDAWVTTASDIEQDVKDNLLALLKKITGKTIQLHQDVNADLLGGFVVNFSGYQYDASTRRLMNKLSDNFKEDLFVPQV